MTVDYALFAGASVWLQKRDNLQNAEAGIIDFAQRFFAFVYTLSQDVRGEGALDRILPACR